MIHISDFTFASWLQCLPQSHRQPDALRCRSASKHHRSSSAPAAPRKSRCAACSKCPTCRRRPQNIKILGATNTLGVRLRIHGATIMPQKFSRASRSFLHIYLFCACCRCRFLRRIWVGFGLHFGSHLGASRVSGVLFFLVGSEGRCLNRGLPRSPQRHPWQAYMLQNDPQEGHKVS